VKDFPCAGASDDGLSRLRGLEIRDGVLLLLGIWRCWIALLLVPLIAGTIVLVHGKNGWLFSDKDGGRMRH
jgi:uncharacterized membrane protein YphA (DoxX/SURF4 family)